ncbi:MAG: hypothetical protein ACFE9X_13750 [Promethearchaeota archaeon]
MIKNIKKNLALTVLFTSIIILSLFQNVNITYGQGNGDPLTVYSDFKMLELGETNGEMLNASSIEFSLPSENWNLTNIELNFTGIQSRREIKDIEILPVAALLLYKTRRGMGVQINITKPTEIYRVHIYGYESAPITTTNVSIQISGYDSIANRPNETIYGSTQINISSEINWYIQNFSKPVFLNPGNYYLVMNGTGMVSSDNGRYYWFNNNNPENPNLHTSEWDKDLGVWTNGITGEPFLYKLDQKIIGQFYPEHMNMTVDIDGISYPVSDGVDPGTGFLNESISLAPSDHNITIPIRINSSINLIFNLSYTFNLQTQLICDGSAIINHDSPIFWTLTPIIERFYDYQFIQFLYPKSWYNFTIFQQIASIWENKTSEIYFNENYFIITNNTITNDDKWMITANSANINLNLNLPITELKPRQNLQFSSTIVEGNFTVFITNPGNFRSQESMNITLGSGETVFSYTIPGNSHEGTYLLEIYWNNATDAGAQSKQFEVIVPLPGVDPMMIVIGVVIAIVVSALSAFSYIKIKKYRNRKIEEAQNIYDKCMDVLNLDYIIVSNKKSGLNVYQQQFTEKEIDAAMISGFLQAIHSFGIELIKIEDQSQTIKLEYKDSIIIMTEFVNLRLILIMKEHPSPNFLYSLEDLSYDIYKYYGKFIDEFTGDIKPFKPIEKLLKHHLNTSLTYPLQIARIEKLESIKIKPSEKSFINRAISSMKRNNIDYFYLNSLLPEKSCTPKDIEIIINLMNNNIIQVKE